MAEHRWRQHVRRLPPTRPLKDSQQGLIKQGDGTVAIIANGHDPAGAADAPSLLRVERRSPRGVGCVHARPRC